MGYNTKIAYSDRMLLVLDRKFTPGRCLAIHISTEYITNDYLL